MLVVSISLAHLQDSFSCVRLLASELSTLEHAWHFGWNLICLHSLPRKTHKHIWKGRSRTGAIIAVLVIQWGI